MSFTTVPIQITGPSYQSRSKPLSSQKTQNWYQQYSENGKDEFVLMPFPGLKTISNASGVDRGLHRMNEVMYQVKGTELYSIDKLGNHTSLGTIAGSTRTISANDGINLVIVAYPKVYMYSSDTGDILELTSGTIAGAKSVTTINSLFLFTFDSVTTAYYIDNDSKALDYQGQIAEETQPDAMVRDYVFDEIIYRCGTRSIVGWWNSGTGTPPIEKLQGRADSVGLSAIYSIANTDEAFYWLGDDHAIYRSQAGSKERISTDAISNSIEKFSVIDDAIGATFTMQGQNFYCLTFPTEQHTFIVNESLGVNGWFELSSGIENGKYQGSSFINAYGKTYVADSVNGNIYELDLDTYTNNDESIHRIRTTSSINGKIAGAQGKRVQMSRFEIIMETGVGLIDGQGDNPRIMIEASYDGGRSFSHGTWARTGRLGEFVLKVEWFSMKSFYDCILRISTTDPVNYTIYSAAIDLRLAGK